MCWRIRYFIPASGLMEVCGICSPPPVFMPSSDILTPYSASCWASTFLSYSLQFALLSSLEAKRDSPSLSISTSADAGLSHLHLLDRVAHGSKRSISQELLAHHFSSNHCEERRKEPSVSSKWSEQPVTFLFPVQPIKITHCLDQ